MAGAIIDLSQLRLATGRATGEPVLHVDLVFLAQNIDQQVVAALAERELAVVQAA